MAPKAADGAKDRTGRSGRLRAIEQEQQKYWEENKLNEYDAPKEGEEAPPKYLCTFPYPYMNGRLHIGHAFSFSKAEIQVGYQRLKGKQALLPFGFHVTGMPIAACAMRLKNELEAFGNPPKFPEEDPKFIEEEKAREAAEAEVEVSAGKKFSRNMSKVASKTQRQYNIMKKYEVEDPGSFRDPQTWLDYFPPLAIQDLKAFGSRVDWRRTFYTTEVNPFYDSFIKWQFAHLLKQDRLAFGKRLAVYCIADGQPCADHDRSEGEGVGPQEYTLIKMELLDVASVEAVKPHVEKLGGKPLFLLAGTLRPETMFGQTNCWLQVEGEYGVYDIDGESFGLMAPRAAKNMSWQGGMVQKNCDPEPVFKVFGKELIGAAVKSPLAKYEKIHILPMDAVKMDKGTGVVTSVPADSPDDFVNWKNLCTKPDWREKKGVKEEWIVPFDLVPVTSVEELGGSLIAKTLVEGGKLSHAECHAKAYLLSWEQGVMDCSDERYNGKRVRVVRQDIRDSLIQEGRALTYSEPEKRVMSRSGEECVVALCDQWFLKYGKSDEAWQKKIRDYVTSDQLNTYHPAIKKAFTDVVEWLGEWPCSRTFGLGTALPSTEQGGDTKYLIDSLSDSTIYMAYYTVATYLQNGTMKGDPQGGLTAEMMTPDVWDAIFLGTTPIDDLKVDCDKEVLKAMRREFTYWYPMDLRVSGKDLVQNHLTMALYNHSAIFGDEMLPKAYFCNGHIMVDNEKMSKAKGNFLTLEESINEYGADALRMGMAESGDGMEDANFTRSVANANVLRLTKELDWITDMSSEEKQKVLRDGEYNFFDRIFDNALNKAIQVADDAYNRMVYRDALAASCHTLQTARDVYRLSMNGDNGMHKNLVRRYIECHSVLLSPITPHWSDHVWRNVLKREGSVIRGQWPAMTAEVDRVMEATATYLDDLITDVRKNKEKQAKKDPELAKHAVLYVVGSYTEHQRTALTWLQDVWGRNDKTIPADVGKSVPESLIPHKKVIMPFIGLVKEQAAKFDAKAFEHSPVVDELKVITDQSDYIKAQIGLETLVVYDCNDAGAPDVNKMKTKCKPTKPSSAFQAPKN